MRGVIIEQLKHNYMTNINDLFSVMNGIEKKYNFFIYSYSCNDYPSEKLPAGVDYVWLTGAEFSNLVKENDIQFIFGLISAIPKDIPLAKILENKLGYYDDGNAELWMGNIDTQIPEAEFEFIPYDSEYVVVISKNDAILDLINANYSSTDMQKFMN